MKNKTKNILIAAVRAVATAAIWSVAIYLLAKYEYLSQIAQVDNFVGMIPVALMVIFGAGATALVWLKPDKQHRAIAIVLAVVTVFSIALFPNALRGNWWIADKSLNLQGESSDISVYEPFKENNQTAKLEQTSTLKFTEDFPVMDGALALYPVYSAIAETVYDEQSFDPQSVAFTNTLRAFDAIIAGERDVIFVAAASKTQLEKAKEAGVELVFTPIGKEAFVFLVGKDNPVENITYQQIRNVYSGKTAKWRTLGWKEGGSIVAFQRPEGSGSQTGIQGIMKDLPLVAPQPLPDKSLIGSNSLMQQLSATYNGVQPVLGYSFRFFANTMYPNENAKMLKVNGVEPSAENIANGKYPFAVQFYAVTNGQPQGNTKTLIDWILSPQGQLLIEKCGYSPIG